MMMKGFLIVVCKRIYHYSIIRMNHYLSTMRYNFSNVFLAFLPEAKLG